MRSTNARDVGIPVLEKCIKVADVPVAPVAKIPKDADPGQEASGVSAYARAAKLYVKRADALLRKCATD